MRSIGSNIVRRCLAASSRMPTSSAPSAAATTTTTAAMPAPRRAVSVSVAAAAAAAASSSSSSADFPGRSVKVSHILVPRERASELDDVEAALASGSTTFESAARERSTCPSSSAGGQLGWLGRGDTVPEFEQAAFSTPVGKTARAETDFGVHLLRVDDDRPGAIEVAQMGPTELRDLLEEIRSQEKTVQLIDVREEGEFETAKIQGFVLKPLSQISEWGPSAARDLDPAAETVCLCHHGMRSQQVANFLVTQAGFKRVFNVSGGIDAYSRLCDPSVPRY